MKKCSKCRKEKPISEFIWFRTNKEYAHCSDCKEYIHTMERSIPAGIYVIKENGKVIYVGESDIPYRRRKEHFAKYKDWHSVKHKSELTKAIFRGELNVDDLTFEMIHENVDPGVKYSPKREKIERIEIEKYSPKYNLDKPNPNIKKFVK